MYSRARFQLLVAFTAGTPRSHLRGTFQSRRNDPGKCLITALFGEFLLAGGCSSAYINSAVVLPSANSLTHAYMYEWNVRSPCHIDHSAGSAESMYGVSYNSSQVRKKKLNNFLDRHTRMEFIQGLYLVQSQIPRKDSGPLHCNLFQQESTCRLHFNIKGSVLLRHRWPMRRMVKSAQVSR